jgi:hypothetical protein
MHELILIEQLPSFTPALARKLIAVLRERTGTEPQAMRPDNGYRVRLLPPRVTLTMGWHRTRSARTWSYNSTLLLDGEQLELPRDLEESVTIWHDPDLRTRPPCATPTSRPSVRRPTRSPLRSKPSTAETASESPDATGPSNSATANRNGRS